MNAFKAPKDLKQKKIRTKKVALNFNLSSFWASKAFQSGRRMKATTTKKKEAFQAVKKVEMDFQILVCGFFK